MCVENAKTWAKRFATSGVVIGVLGLHTAGSEVRAAEEHTDIWLTVDEGVIRTNRESGGLLIPERVFGADLGEVAPDFTDEPGFDCEPGTFAVPSAITFAFTRALRVWNGTAFSEIAESAMLAEFGPLSRVSPAVDQTVAGFPLAVGSNGEWHRHLGFTLQAPATIGVYLLEMTLASDAPGIAPTPSFWLVFNQGEAELVHERALVWARIHLASKCPADLDGGAGDGLPDNAVDINDLLAFLVHFEVGDVSADLDDGQAGGLPDGGVDVNDLLYFLVRFEGGC